MLENARPKPHLIHIGFPKCASTFLQQWFAAHPQLIYRPGALGGMYTAQDLVVDLLWPDDGAMVRVTSAEQLSDPRDPATFGSIDIPDPALRAARMEQVCLALADMFGDAKILIITRNHFDLLVSGCSQLIREGAPFVDDEIRQFDSSRFGDAKPFDYAMALRLYQRHFAGRVLALPYEMLVDDRPGFLAATADFAGVDHFDTADGRINAALSGEQLYWYPRIARLFGKIPVARVANRLRNLHVHMIRNGGWRPLLLALRLFGRRSTDLHSLLAGAKPHLQIDCEELLKSEYYAPYRDLYRGSA